jgi:DNA-binding NtrC family response regulator
MVDHAATILVVEDDDAVRELIGRILRNDGFEVIVVDSGAEAIEICESYKGRIDLLLTDVVMPQMSGVALRDLAMPLRPGMKVLFMSGYNDELIAQRGVVASDKNLLLKPFKRDKLLESVRSVLRQE